VHLAEAGIHSSEAVTLYKKSPEQSTWHEFHLAKRSDKEMILAAEASGDDVSNLTGQKLAIIALSFSHCLPMTNTSLIKPGWYDRLKFPGVAVRAIRLIGFPYIPNYLTHNHQDPRSVRRHGYVISSRWERLGVITYRS
jgi:hypothetical protein